MKNKITNNWYFVENVNGNYYTPFTTTKTKYFHSGDGSTPPTPKEIVEIINQKDKKFYEGAKCFYDVSKESSQDAVQLPDGVYLYSPEDHYGGRPERIIPFDLRTEKLFNFKDSSKSIKEDIKLFLANKEKYDNLNILYRLGLLLYGPPGTSKTSTIRQLINDAIPKEALIIFFNSDLPEIEFMQKLKLTCADRLKVFIFEELVAGLKNWNIEHLLSFLDGEHSIENTIIIATTNYPQDLPMNLANRPSRFDKLYNFESISKQEITEFVTSLIKRAPTEEEIKEIGTLSIAAIKEACLVFLLKEIPFINAIKEQKNRISLCKKSFAPESKLGFSGFNEYD